MVRTFSRVPTMSVQLRVNGRFSRYRCAPVLTSMASYTTASTTAEPFGASGAEAGQKRLTAEPLSQ